MLSPNPLDDSHFAGGFWPAVDDFTTPDSYRYTQTNKCSVDSTIHVKTPGVGRKRSRKIESMVKPEARRLWMYPPA